MDVFFSVSLKITHFAINGMTKKIRSKNNGDTKSCKQFVWIYFAVGSIFLSFSFHSKAELPSEFEIFRLCAVNLLFHPFIAIYSNFIFNIKVTFCCCKFASQKGMQINCCESFFFCSAPADHSLLVFIWQHSRDFNQITWLKCCTQRESEWRRHT